MENTYCKLVVEIEVEGLGGTRETDFYMQSSLINLDKYTLSYESEEDFFSKNKKRIMSAKGKEYEEKTSFPPTDINLRGIYIAGENHEMRALFHTIKYKDKTIPLQDIILKKMWEGRMYSFYNCDKKRASSEEYDSFFKEVNPSILERIELNCCTCADIISVWNKISSSQRIVPLIRFLLIGKKEDNFEKLFNQFCERIPPKEDTNNTINNEVDKENEGMKKNIRLPYAKDDE